MDIGTAIVLSVLCFTVLGIVIAAGYFLTRYDNMD